MLSPEKAGLVVGTVQQHLLTPYGLRSLAPTDPQYRGRYTGDPVSRDGAYHQGTVWPWLMGPFHHCLHKGEPKQRASEATGGNLAGCIQGAPFACGSRSYFRSLRRRCAYYGATDPVSECRDKEVRLGTWETLCQLYLFSPLGADAGTAIRGAVHGK